MWKVLKIINHDIDGKKIDVPVIWNSDKLVLEPIPSLWLLKLRGFDGKGFNTVYNYASTLCLLINEVSRDPDIDGWQSMDEKRMYAFLEYKLSKERGVSGSTLDQYIERLKQFYEWAYKEGWLPVQPRFSWRPSEETYTNMAKEKGTRNAHDMFNLSSQYISPDEFNDLLGFKPSNKAFEMERDDLILKMGYHCGFRSAETIDEYNVEISRIRAAIAKAEKKERLGFWLDIIGKGKNGGKVRTVYFPEHLKSQLLRFLDTTWSLTVPKNSQLLICKRDGSPIRNAQHASKLFAASVANLVGGKDQDIKSPWIKNNKRRFHSLRHSYATNLAQYCKQNGEPYTLVQDRMGHSDFSTTKIYIHFNAILNNDKATADEMASQLPSHMTNFLNGDM